MLDGQSVTEALGLLDDPTPVVAFETTPSQGKFFAAALSGDYTFLAYGGGIRSGKSAATIMLLQLLCRIYPGSRWAIVRKDLPTIRRNVLPTFEKFRIRGFMGPLNMVDWSYTANNGSKIILFPESIAEDPELNRWRGLEVNGFALEEANELQQKSMAKAIERAGSWVIPHTAIQPKPMVFATFNPSGGWVKRTWYDPWKAGTLRAPYFFQPATILDNPHIPEAYKASLKQLPERDYKRFVEGDWSFISGAYFGELGVETHLVQAPYARDQWPSWWTHWGAYDYGFRHPAVFGAFSKDGDGQMYWRDTLRMHRMEDEPQARLVFEKAPSECRALVFAGPDAFAKRAAHIAAIESVRDVFARYRTNFLPAYTARVQGWAAVRRALTLRQPDGTIGRPNLLICDTPGNRWAIERLLEMIPDPTDPDDVLKVDADEDGQGGDDVADMLRYAIATTATAKRPAQERDVPQDRSPKFDLQKRAFIRQDPRTILDDLLDDEPTGIHLPRRFLGD